MTLWGENWNWEDWKKNSPAPDSTPSKQPTGIEQDFLIGAALIMRRLKTPKRIENLALGILHGHHNH